MICQIKSFLDLQVIFLPIHILEKSAPYRNPCSAGGLKEKDPTYSNGIVHHKSHKCKTTSFKSPIWNMLSIQVDNYGWNYITNVTYVLELGLTIFHWNLNPVQNTYSASNLNSPLQVHWEKNHKNIVQVSVAISQPILA